MSGAAPARQPSAKQLRSGPASLPAAPRSGNGRTGALHPCRLEGLERIIRLEPNGLSGSERDETMRRLRPASHSFDPSGRDPHSWGISSRRFAAHRKVSHRWLQGYLNEFVWRPNAGYPPARVRRPHAPSSDRRVARASARSPNRECLSLGTLVCLVTAFTTCWRRRNLPDHPLEVLPLGDRDFVAAGVFCVGSSADDLRSGIAWKMAAHAPASRAHHGG